MKKIAFGLLLAAQSCLVADVLAQEQAVAKLDLKVGEITDDKPISAKFAYCMPDGKGHTKDGGNISPSISWLDAPAGTKSYVLLVVDPDVPAKFDNANKPGRVIRSDFPRQNFYHWVLINIPSKVKGLLEGKDSNGITKGGKPTGRTEYGINGINGYGFGGYDGPCPPWNDERMHHYHFMVYALDVPSLKLPEPVNGKLVESEMVGHILAKGEVVGTYTNNPSGAQ